MNESLKSRPWMRTVLMTAGVYNLAWGLLTVVMPHASLSWLGLDSEPPVAQLWQCIGMIVGVYGVGYLIASRDVYRHWPITLVGLLGKVFGPIGFGVSVFAGTLPATVGWTVITNDLIWWIPFSAILWGAIRFHQASGTAYTEPEIDDPIRELLTNGGETLESLANRQPQLILLLRHAGCTFCRESLADLSRQREMIEAKGCGIVLVHMGDNDRDAAFFEKYSLGDVPRISDPDCRLYRQFGLDLGSLSELFGFRVVLRGLVAGILHRHGVGRLLGNSFQMPGVYVYHCGRIVTGFQHAHASDRPNYVELVGPAESFSASAATI